MKSGNIRTAFRYVIVRAAYVVSGCLVSTLISLRGNSSNYRVSSFQENKTNRAVFSPTTLRFFRLIHSALKQFHKQKGCRSFSSQKKTL